jgi:hypothetical protein
VRINAASRRACGCSMWAANCGERTANCAVPVVAGWQRARRCRAMGRGKAAVDSLTSGGYRGAIAGVGASENFASCG